MNISIKKRIYWSFFVLVFLFVINGIASLITLSDNRKLSENVSTVTDPSLQSLEDFEDLLVSSKMYTTNWVFLRSSQEDKDALIKLHNSDYPKLKQRLSLLYPRWDDKPSEDSLKKIFAGFEKLLVFEKMIMTSLQEFEDYNDPMKKLEAERIVEDELLPRTSALLKTLGGLETTGKSVRAEKNKELEESFLHLKMLILFLSVTIICIGVFLSLYMAQVIINPINKIRDIINDLGKGITRLSDNKQRNDEIGEMISSVNHLSEKLHDTSAFAIEIGNRNFHSYFEPLSPQDTLGKALVAMRDSIKLSDQKLNDAQHIASIGSWERDLATDKFTMSDEMYNILDIDSSSFDFQFKSILKFVHPDDLQYVLDTVEKNLYLAAVPFEFRIFTAKGVLKNVRIESKLKLGKYGEVEQSFGILQDITERKRSEAKLAAERELFQLVIENMPDQVYLKDTESRFILCNKPVAINAGCTSQDELTGKTDFDFLPIQVAKQHFIDEQSIMRSGIPVINHEEQILDKVTGQSRWSLSTKFPLKNNEGDMIGLVGINHDITKRKIAEKKLENANRELSILFNSIDEVFFSVNMATLKVIQISPTCENLYGYSQEEFLANYTLWFEIIHPDDRHIIENEDEEMRRGEQINNRYRIIRKDKGIRWVETKITPTLDIQGKLTRVDGVTRDITERKVSEEELQEVSERLQLATHAAKIGIWDYDLVSNKLIWDEGMCKLYDINARDFSGVYEAWEAQLHPDDLLMGREEIQMAIRGEKEFDTEFRVVWPDKSVHHIKGNASVHRDPSGKALRMIGTNWDITEMKIAEKALSLAQFTVQNATHAIYWIKPDGTFYNINKAASSMLGYTSEELLKLSVPDIDPFYTDEVWPLHWKDLSNKKIVTFITKQRRKDGGLIDVQVDAHFFRFDNLEMNCAFVYDITERKKAEIALLESQKQIQTIFDAALDAIIIINEEGNIVKWDSKSEILFGWKEDEVLGSSLTEIIIPHRYREAHDRGIKHFLKTGEGAALGKTLEVSALNKNNEEFDISLSVSPSFINNKYQFIGFVRDITSRKKAEKELHASEERYRQIVETAQEGIWMIDENNNTTFINKKMCEIVEYTAEELSGKRIHEFMDEAANKNAVEQIERRKSGISETHDSIFITKSGRAVWTSLSTNPVFDNAGVYKGALAMVTDITARKQDEVLLQKSQANLEINNRILEQKNKELEQFAYVASHDLQEPLSTTISFVELFKKQYFEKLDPKADKYLTYIVQASDRMKVLIKDLLDFSRIGHSKQIEKADCNIILHQVVQDIDKAIKDSGAQIIAEDLPVVRGYATELKQLFQNLLLNSIKFSKDDVLPEINISAKRKNDYWEFAFSDNGIGIDEQHNERIFIIFQRLHTRSQYQGSGIGLSHCKKIVELHHGKIWVDSTPGNGSTFYFTIHSPKDTINEPKTKLHNAY